MYNMQIKQGTFEKNPLAFSDTFNITLIGILMFKSTRYRLTCQRLRRILFLVCLHNMLGFIDSARLLHQTDRYSQPFRVVEQGNYHVILHTITW